MSWSVRASPRLRTRAVTSTSADPSGSRRVTIPGASTSLAPSGRIVTSRSMPPKLNQTRCQAVAFMIAGERQSARTSSVWWPAVRCGRASNGR